MEPQLLSRLAIVPGRWRHISIAIVPAKKVGLAFVLIEWVHIEVLENLVKLDIPSFKGAARCRSELRRARLLATCNLLLLQEVTEGIVEAYPEVPLGRLLGRHFGRRLRSFDGSLCDGRLLWSRSILRGGNRSNLRRRL